MDPPTPQRSRTLCDTGVPLAKWRKWTLFACTCVLLFLLQLDMSSVAVALPMIAKDLGASQVLLFTVATAYLLAQTVAQLVFSHVSHGTGRRNAYLLGVILYLIGAIVAVTSRSAKQLVGARVVQGTGAAGMLTMSAIVIVDIMQPRQRAAWSALSQAFGALGNISGPLVAGALFKRFDWHSVFAMQVSVAAILFLALFALLPRHLGQTGSKGPGTWKALKRCDWLGMLSFLVGSVLCLVAINIGGSVVPWNSPLVIVCLVLGAGFLVALGLHERFRAKQPAFPRELFNKGITNAAFVGTLISGMLLSMLYYKIVLFWEGVRRLSTVQVGLMLLPVMLTYATLAAGTGIAIKIWGNVRWANIAGAACAMAGLGPMCFLLNNVVPVGPIVVVTVCAAAGCGIMIPGIINTILAPTDKEWHGHAIAMRTLLHTAGQCMGVSVGLAIFTHRFEYHMGRVVGGRR